MTPEEERIILRYISLNELPTFLNQSQMDMPKVIKGIPIEMNDRLQAAYRQAKVDLLSIKCSIFILHIHSTENKFVFEGYQQGEKLRVTIEPTQLKNMCREVYKEIKRGAL